MFIKSFCVLIVTSLLFGCEHKHSLGLEHKAAIKPPDDTAASDIPAELIPTAIEAAPAGSAQQLTLEAIQKAAKDEEEDQGHQ